MWRSIVGLISLTFLVSIAQGADELPQKAYDILKNNCFACHGAAKTSGLDLRSRETMLAGGQRGPAVTPSNLRRSLLFSFVSHEAEPNMPPGKKLPDADIATLREWILNGADLTGVNIPPEL